MAKINGQNHACLLDTGIKVSILPASVVDPNQIRPEVRELLAANGSKIPVFGVATVPFTTDTYQSTLDVLVSDHIHEVILGVDWIHGNNALCDFRKKIVTIDGRPHQLIDNPEHRQWSRCIIVLTDISIPSQCCKVELRRAPNRAEVNSSWGTSPTTLHVGPGLYVASTLLSEQRFKDEPVQVMNTRNEPRFIKAEAVVGAVVRPAVRCPSRSCA